MTISMVVVVMVMMVVVVITLSLPIFSPVLQWAIAHTGNCLPNPPFGNTPVAQFFCQIYFRNTFAGYSIINQIWKYSKIKCDEAGKEVSPRWGRSQEDNPSQARLDSEARRQTASWKTILIIINLHLRHQTGKLTFEEIPQFEAFASLNRTIRKVSQNLLSEIFLDFLAHFLKHSSIDDLMANTPII